jgi:hypothetical protein
LLKTLMLSSEWGSTLVSLAWRPKATPQGRLLFQLAVSGLSTEETAASLLGPPTVNDGKNSITESQRGRNTLTAGLLPAARCADGMSHNLRSPENIGNPRGRLEDVMAMLPTPVTARGNNRSINPDAAMTAIKRGQSVGLGYTISLLATPAAADCQGSHGGGQGRSLRADIHNHRRTTGETGLLNPYFVEMMMGFPQGWTLEHEPHDCEH